MISKALLTAALILAYCAHAAEPASISKRGCCGAGSAVQALGASWYYDWYIEPHKIDAEFIPMIKHGADANSWYFDKIMKLKADGKAKVLLGFNEPERKDQGNTSVDEALQKWPLLEKTGLRLGSPAVSSDGAGRKWLDSFMKGADEQKLRVDFIAIHWYDDASEHNASAKFMAYIKDLHTRFHRPIWITEFAGINWKHCKAPVTAEVDHKFLSQVLPLLEKADYVERYAWFSQKGEAELFKDGKAPELSELGKLYRDAPKR